VYGGAFTKSWEGLVERPTLERVRAHLDAAGFPRVEEHAIPVGSTLRAILVQSGALDVHSTPIAWTAGAEMKGYREAFAILDSLMAELGKGAIRRVRLGEGGLTRRPEKPIRPALPIAEAFELGHAAAARGAPAEAIVSGLGAEAYGLGRAAAA